MLGWFKKKFGKKPAEPEVVVPEPIQDAVEEVLAAEPLVDQTLAAQEPVAEISEPVAVADLHAPVDAETVDAEPAVDTAPAAVEPVASPEPTAMVAEPVLDDAVAAEAVEAVEPVEPNEPNEAVAPIEPAAESAAEPVASEVAAETESAASDGPAAPSPEAVVAQPVAEDVDDVAAPVGRQEIEEQITVSEAEAADEQVDEVDAEPSASSVVPAAPLVSKTQEKPSSKSLFKRLQERLGKTRDSFVYRLDRLFLGKKEIDQDLFEQLEEILITADLGVATTLELLDGARKKVKRDQLSDPQALKAIIRDQIATYIQASEQPAELVMPENGPFVIMVVGVNGVGKTTSIGKIAAKFVRAGQSVLMVAGDTFRAAAINQLRIWGERVGVEVIAQNPGADPSSVVYDGLEYGVAHNFDVILIDTAGRLHTSVNLMEELKKIKRVIGKKMEGAPHEVMLVLDATTGQNGISQAKMFHEAVGVSGLTLTKLDGTAKGGIVANVCRETKIPVRFIGIGEQIDDLRDFDAREFVDALFAGQER
jgi:fused signal recognition particle receptor